MPPVRWPSQLVIAALAHLDDDEPGGDLLSKLDEAVHDGNTAIAAHVEMEPELEGMGTTLTAILFAGNRLGLVNIRRLTRLPAARRRAHPDHQGTTPSSRPSSTRAGSPPRRRTAIRSAR